MKERIRELRKTLNLTQLKFGESLGFGKTTINGWEGNNAIPENAIIAICRTYNVRREWLETGEGDIFEPPTPPEIGPYDYAKLQGCGDLMAKVFEGYCGLNEENKKIFESIVAKIIDEK